MILGVYILLERTKMLNIMHDYVLARKLSYDQYMSILRTDAETISEYCLYVERDDGTILPYAAKFSPLASEYGKTYVVWYVVGIQDLIRSLSLRS